MLVANVAVLGEALLNDASQIRWDLGIQERGGQRVAVENPVDDERGRVRGKGLLASRDLVEHDAEGEQVRPRVDLFAPDLLGRHVRPRADGTPRGGPVASRSGDRRMACGVQGTHFRNAEIEDFVGPRVVTKRLAGLMSRWMMPAA
jgi:hypothetical protein